MSKEKRDHILFLKDILDAISQTGGAVGKNTDYFRALL